MTSWLDELMAATADAESPRQFVYWAGLTAISSVVKKNVYLQRGRIYRLYPNLFVITVAKTGGRKQFPVDVLRNLLWELKEIRVVSGHNTIQGIAATLKDAKTEDGVVYPDAQACLCSSEFSNLVQNDSDALTWLTAWYDTHSKECEKWEKTLKSEKIVLKNICISLFGATNLEHFNERLSEKDVKGGFIGRTLLVESNKRGKLNALVDEEDETAELIDYPKLAKRLREISKISGRFKWEEKARAEFKEWYLLFNSDLENAELQDRTGFADRVHDHILKVSMLLSLAEKDELLITQANLKQAMMLVLPLLDRARELLKGKGKSDTAYQTAIVLQAILDKPNYQLTREYIIKRMWNDVNSMTLDTVVKTLKDGGYIEEVYEGEDTIYRLTERCRAEYEAIKRKEVI